MASHYVDPRLRHVLVIDAREVRGAGTLGDVLAARAHALGAAAIVTDGGVRDASVVAELGIPTFAAYKHPGLIGRHHVPWAIDEVIACGGVAVRPGDVIVGDDDGVVVIPESLVEEVEADALQQEREEEFIAEMVADGHRLEGLYPMDSAWRDSFETWAAARAGEKA